MNHAKRIIVLVIHSFTRFYSSFIFLLTFDIIYVRIGNELILLYSTCQEGEKRDTTT